VLSDSKQANQTSHSFRLRAPKRTEPANSAGRRLSCERADWPRSQRRRRLRSGACALAGQLPASRPDDPGASMSRPLATLKTRAARNRTRKCRRRRRRRRRAHLALSSHLRRRRRHLERRRQAGRLSPSRPSREPRAEGQGRPARLCPSSSPALIAQMIANLGANLNARLSPERHNPNCKSAASSSACPPACLPLGQAR